MKQGTNIGFRSTSESMLCVGFSRHRRKKSLLNIYPPFTPHIAAVTRRVWIRAVLKLACQMVLALQPQCARSTYFRLYNTTQDGTMVALLARLQGSNVEHGVKPSEHPHGRLTIKSRATPREVSFTEIYSGSSEHSLAPIHDVGEYPNSVFVARIHHPHLRPSLRFLTLIKSNY